MPVRLSSKELKSYHEKGWIVPDYTLSEDLLNNMRAEYDILLKNMRILLLT